jgi:hypothetical protein
VIPHGGTFVRPGVIAWEGILAPAGRQAAQAGCSSCEVVERAIAAALADERALPELMRELSRARVWLPLPDGPEPVTDGSAVTVRVITVAGTDFLAAFTSGRRLAAWASPRSMRAGPAAAPGPSRSGDPAWARDAATGPAMIRHIVVPLRGLARRVPAGLGIAVNPGTGMSVRLCPDAMAHLPGPDG